MYMHIVAAMETSPSAPGPILAPVPVPPARPADPPADPPAGRAAMEPAAVGHLVRAVRGLVPGRAGRVDDWCRAPGHPDRPAPEHLVAAVDRQRLRAGLRRPAAARGPGRRPAPPPPGGPGRAGPVRR